MTDTGQVTEFQSQHIGDAIIHHTGEGKVKRRKGGIAAHMAAAHPVGDKVHGSQAQAGTTVSSRLVRPAVAHGTS